MSHRDPENIGHCHCFIDRDTQLNPTPQTPNEPYFPSCLIRVLALSKTGYGRMIDASQNDTEERHSSPGRD